jgi:hypothetical protein
VRPIERGHHAKQVVTEFHANHRQVVTEFHANHRQVVTESHANYRQVVTEFHANHRQVVTEFHATGIYANRTDINGIPSTSLQDIAEERREKGNKAGTRTKTGRWK